MVSLVDPAAPADRQPSPVGLTLNLSSNNPFRNRTTSPSPRTPTFNTTGPPPTQQQPPRPLSRNPFLDDSEVSQSDDRTKSKAVALPEDIFSELALLDKPLSHGENGVHGAGAYIVKPQSRTAPPRPVGTPAVYRPTGAGDRPPRPMREPESPDKSAFKQSRPRRASESSVMEKDRRPRTERDRYEGRERTESEERRRQERRKEREERHRREKEKTRNGDKPRRKPQGLDIIDKLDVTGIYGQGLFHHDGPFDACNPHRNSKRDRRAPMQAFPADSANMQLGGSGPVRSRLDLDKFHGRGEESFSEYALTRKADTTVIDPTQRGEQVHGEESYGLGTSTFLEGAPVSKSAMQRRDSEDPEVSGPGLSRKKSIVQRFRGMSGSRRYGPGDVRTPDARYQAGRPVSPPVQQTKAVSAGGPLQARYNKENEINPFDNDYEAAFAKKGAQIKIAEQERPSAAGQRAPGSPKGPILSRSVTSDGRVQGRGRGSSGEEERQKEGGGGVSGFLSRMKSVKGGARRPKNVAE